MKHYIAFAAALFVVGCGKEQPKNESPTGAPAATEQKAESGRVIVVETYSDANGNYFKPAEIEAHKGDIVRFTNVAGAHNVNFLPDSNPGKTGLPAASEVLQIPGQTYDLKVTFGEGKYYFQCDPHAALGMKGHLKVED
jgi:plastocyanin